MLVIDDAGALGPRAKDFLFMEHVTMPGLFKKAAEKGRKGDQSAKKKKATNWVVGDPEGDKVGKAVHELVRLSGEEKALKAKMKIHKQIVEKHAEGSFVGDFSQDGVMPETPMKVVNAEGESVTYVVQDRSSQYALKEEQIDALTELLGEDSVNDIVYTEHSIGFNREVMAIPGVAEVVEKSLESAIRKLVKDEVIDGDTADELVEVKEKTALKPGTLSRAADLVGRDQTRLQRFINTVGSCVTKYVKV